MLHNAASGRHLATKTKQERAVPSNIRNHEDLTINGIYPFDLKIPIYKAHGIFSSRIISLPMPSSDKTIRRKGKYCSSHDSTIFIIRRE